MQQWKQRGYVPDSDEDEELRSNESQHYQSSRGGNEEKHATSNGRGVGIQIEFENEELLVTRQSDNSFNSNTRQAHGNQEVSGTISNRLNA